MLSKHNLDHILRVHKLKNLKKNQIWTPATWICLVCLYIWCIINISQELLSQRERMFAIQPVAVMRKLKLSLVELNITCISLGLSCKTLYLSLKWSELTFERNYLTALTMTYSKTSQHQTQPGSNNLSII